jgi:uncharacterized protein (DUF2062 family)
MSHATSAADITDQSHSKVGSPTANPARAMSVIAVIRMIQRFFTFVIMTFTFYQNRRQNYSKMIGK